MLGSYQDDQFQYHLTRHGHDVDIPAGNQPGTSRDNLVRHVKPGPKAIGRAIEDDAFPTTGRHGKETRSNNISVTFIIKY
ncbi:MAG TPA: hypothetical protein VMZ31_13515 [Phycisphaerae bacterium]|nr:hypothetical protein [Phycisphaerae bacterium]